MKRILLCLLSSSVLWSMQAQFSTPNTGVSWNFDSLVAKSGGAVTKTADNYVINSTITISPKDALFVNTDILVKIAADMGIIVNGGSFTVKAPNKAEFTALGPYSESERTGYWGSLEVRDSAKVYLLNAAFMFGHGVKVLLDKYEFRADSCVFAQMTNGSSPGFVSTSAAIDANRGTVILNACSFMTNYYPALGSAANTGCIFKVRNCLFEMNCTSNGNRPQINLGPTPEGFTTEIVGNSIMGDRSFEKVGAISTSVLAGGVGNFRIDSNHIEDNRYGITLSGANITAQIGYNTILNNNTNSNAMSSGSGINMQDPSGTSFAMITGNHFEGNLWGITLVGKTADYSAGPSVNLGNLEVPNTDPSYNPGLNTFVNNGNGGALHDLFNNNPVDVMAQGNVWNVSAQDSASIETVVSHKVDDARYGTVTFMFHQTNANAPMEDLQYRVYPNPASDVVFIEPGFESVQMFDLSGSCVWSQDTPGYSIPVQSLAEGTYLLRLRDAKQALRTVKVFVRR